MASVTVEFIPIQSWVATGSDAVEVDREAQAIQRLSAFAPLGVGGHGPGVQAHPERGC